jgi:hypothetical protein
MTQGEDAAMKCCFQVNREDNVATLLQDAGLEPVLILGPSRNTTVNVLEEVALGHKVCTCSVSKGELIVKYGVPIGVATGVAKDTSYA